MRLLHDLKIDFMQPLMHTYRRNMTNNVDSSLWQWQLVSIFVAAGSLGDQLAAATMPP